MKSIGTLWKTIIALAIACFCGMQWETKAQGELEYAENLFVMIWYDDSTKTIPEHRFLPLKWSKTAWSVGGNPSSQPTIAFFNNHKEAAGSSSSGVSVKQKLSEEVVFYVQVDTSTSTFFPERALTFKVFLSRRYVLITHEDTGFRRIVPLIRYFKKVNTSIYEKEPRTPVNLGQLE